MFISALDLAKATSAAAIAAQPFVGTGDKNGADGACTDALRSVLNGLPFKGQIIIGEGEKDEAPGLFSGELLGTADTPPCHIAVDPLEGTTFCAKGQANSFSVLAVVEPGAMFDPGPAFYMDKIAVGPEGKGAIDPGAPYEEQLQSLANALGKPTSDLSIYMLERPRNQAILDAVRALGAKACLYSGGDVLGGLMALMDDQPVDALMGIGGSPEGLISAAACKALGGDFFGRLAPQSDAEAGQLKDAGLTTDWLGLDHLISGSQVAFAITGITSGLLLEAPAYNGSFWATDSLMISGPDATLHRLQTYFQKT